jgi:hypothetical protein
VLALDDTPPEEDLADDGTDRVPLRAPAAHAPRPRTKSATAPAEVEAYKPHRQSAWGAACGGAAVVALRTGSRVGFQTSSCR